MALIDVAKKFDSRLLTLMNYITVYLWLNSEDSWPKNCPEVFFLGGGGGRPHRWRLST